MTAPNFSNPWTTISTRVAYENEWLSLREDELIRPDGSVGRFAVVQIPPAAAVVAINSDGDIALVQQWRYSIDRPTIEIPAGVGDSSSETPNETAMRELQEETGLRCTRMTPVGVLYGSVGVTTDQVSVFLAREFVEDVQKAHLNEPVKCLWVNYYDAVEMVLAGDINSAVSAAAILHVELLRQRGRWVF